MITTSGISRVIWVANGIIASSLDNGNIQLWKSTFGDILIPSLILEEHDDAVSSIDVHPSDRNVIASSSWDCT